jgi:hypothetical protein
MQINLPEQEKISDIVNRINQLSLEVANLEYEIELKEAEIVREATTNEKYYAGSKPQSQEFIKNSWRITGFEGELVELRKEFSKKTAELNNEKRNLRLVEMLVDIWRTSSANERLV